MRNRYEFMDGLRGIAALSVGFLHASQLFGVIAPTHAYLAVDFFFCLSGFVIANSYDEKLRDGRMSAQTFMKKRIIRLYPMIMIGALLAAFVSGVGVYTLHRGHYDSLSILIIGAITLLPLGLFVGQQAFALNNPIWSLCFEFVANIAYAFWPCRRRRKDVEVLVLLTLATLLIAVIYKQGNLEQVGFENWNSFACGFVRVALPFYSGILIFRWGIFNTIKIPSVATLFILIAMLMMPIFISNGYYDAVSVIIVIPLIVIASSGVKPSLYLTPLWSLLGRLSYPFYLVHHPIIRMVAKFQMGLHGTVVTGFMILAAISFAGIASFLALKYIDEPLRQYLATSTTSDANVGDLNVS